jgi:hypothetical protein
MNEKWWKIHYYLFLNISFCEALGLNMEGYNCPGPLSI